MFGRDKKEEAPAVQDVDAEMNAPRKSWKETMMPVFACGSGLFSDGYINNVQPPPRPLEKNILPSTKPQQNKS